LIQIAITGYHCTPFCYSKITIECIHKFKDIHGRIKEFITTDPTKIMLKRRALETCISNN